MGNSCGKPESSRRGVVTSGNEDTTEDQANNVRLTTIQPDPATPDSRVSPAGMRPRSNVPLNRKPDGSSSADDPGVGSSRQSPQSSRTQQPLPIRTTHAGGSNSPVPTALATGDKRLISSWSKVAMTHLLAFGSHEELHRAEDAKFTDRIEHAGDGYAAGKELAKQYIEEARASDPEFGKKPLLFICAERHFEVGSTLFELGVMDAMGELTTEFGNREAVVFDEIEPYSHARVETKANELFAQLNSGRDITPDDCTGCYQADWAQILRRMHAKAAGSGVQIRPMEEPRALPGNFERTAAQREEGMVRNIQKSIDEGTSLLQANMGPNHMPKIVDKFSKQCTVIPMVLLTTFDLSRPLDLFATISAFSSREPSLNEEPAALAGEVENQEVPLTLQDDEADDPYYILQRKSYAVSHPDVKGLRIPAKPLKLADFVDIANTLWCAAPMGSALMS